MSNVFKLIFGQVESFHRKAKFNSNYQKIIVSKNSAGVATDYKLIAETAISFDEEGKNNILNFNEIPIGKTQVEAIKIIDSNTFWITSEDEKSSSSARLMKIKL